jgi:glycosyltransferase involved in cell wall biosynthesis
MTNAQNATMLVVLPVPFRSREGVLHMEAQAHNGIQQWSDNFDHVILAAPTMPESIAATAPGIVWKPVSDLAKEGRITFVELPWAYDLSTFFKTYRPTRKLLAGHIRNARYLQFAIGGLQGDWDRVEHEVLLEVTRSSGLLRRMRAQVESALMFRYHRYLIKRCSLGLWHGSDCFHTYSPWCKASFNVHDVHTKPEDCIDETRLKVKLQSVEDEPTIRISYAGRLDAMKAPIEWLKAVAEARDLGVKIRAVWFGEGPLRQEAEQEIERLKLGEIVSLPGFLSDRGKLLEELRASHVLLFTHVTPESPRCLLESLICGTPIVGYRNKFAEELTSSYGGGQFAEIHDWKSLGQELAELAGNRNLLRQLTLDAARNGRRFNDRAVFNERSQLILRYC